MKLTEIFVNESKWTKRAFGITKDGETTNYYHCMARNVDLVCFCLDGAIHYATGWDREHYHKIANAVKEVSGIDSLWTFNDSDERTFEDIIKVCRIVETKYPELFIEREISRY